MSLESFANVRRSLNADSFQERPSLVCDQLNSVCEEPRMSRVEPNFTIGISLVS